MSVKTETTELLDGISAAENRLEKHVTSAKPSEFSAATLQRMAADKRKAEETAAVAKMDKEREDVMQDFDDGIQASHERQARGTAMADAEFQDAKHDKIFVAAEQISKRLGVDQAVVDSMLLAGHLGTADAKGKYRIADVQARLDAHMRQRDGATVADGVEAARSEFARWQATCKREPTANHMEQYQRAKRALASTEQQAGTSTSTGRDAADIQADLATVTAQRDEAFRLAKMSVDSNGTRRNNGRDQEVYRMKKREVAVLKKELADAGGGALDGTDDAVAAMCSDIGQTLLEDIDNNVTRATGNRTAQASFMLKRNRIQAIVGMLKTSPKNGQKMLIDERVQTLRGLITQMPRGSAQREKLEEEESSLREVLKSI